MDFRDEFWGLYNALSPMLETEEKINDFIWTILRKVDKVRDGHHTIDSVRQTLIFLGMIQLDSHAVHMVKNFLKENNPHPDPWESMRLQYLLLIKEAFRDADSFIPPEDCKTELDRQLAEEQNSWLPFLGQVDKELKEHHGL